jgi:hypothetical protein
MVKVECRVRGDIDEPETSGKKYNPFDRRKKERQETTDQMGRAGAG